MSANDLERRLEQLTWPDPGSALHARVRALPLGAPALSWADRVWFSRAWRLGAAAAVAGLMAVEAWSVRAGAGAVVSGLEGVGDGPVMSSSALALADLGLPAAAVDALSSRRPDVDPWPALPSPDLTGDPR